MNNHYYNTNNNYSSNNLISGYRNFQKSNVPFQNNPLLNNNPHFQNMQQTNMNQFYDHMMRYKQAQDIKKMQKINDLDTAFDKSLIIESVIRPIKIVTEDSNELNNRYKILDTNWKNIRNESWAQRTNQPYKNIIKNDNKFIGRTTIDKEELIVHKVTDADKIGILGKFTDLKNDLEKHDNELKIIYSTSKELEHKKKFEYNHKDKYRLKYDPKDFEGLKKDQIEYYKKEQQNLEKDKKNVMDIIESLMNNGILKEDDIKKIENDDKIIENDDTSSLEKQLREELGDNYNKLEQEAKKILSSSSPKFDKNTSDNNIKNKVTVKSYKEEKPEIESSESINNKNTNKNKITVKSRQIDTNSIHSDLSSNIDNLKLKYLNRQKK